MTLKDTDRLIELIDDDIASLDMNMSTESYYVCLCTLQMVKQYIKALPTVPLDWKSIMNDWTEHDNAMIAKGRELERKLNAPKHRRLYRKCVGEANMNRIAKIKIILVTIVVLITYAMLIRTVLLATDSSKTIIESILNFVEMFSIAWFLPKGAISVIEDILDEEDWWKSLE